MLVMSKGTCEKPLTMKETVDKLSYIKIKKFW